MSKFIPIILASGIISFIVTPLVRKLAEVLDFVDNPEARKFHAAPMPMLGGIAIYIGLAAAVAISGLHAYRELMAVMGGATIMTLVGLWDDRVGLSPVPKLVGQVAAGAVLIWGGIQIHLFPMQALNIGLTLFWVVGICNAINFQDNMDGLAAGLATVASAFFFILALVEGLGLVAMLAAATLGACIGFLYYNFSPASLFMGDAGSGLLGFILAVLGIKLQFTGRPLASTWMIPVIILLIPIFDTTLVVISRLRHHKPIWEGGRDHTSHRLVAILQMTAARSVMTLYLVAGALGLTAIMVRDADPAQARLVLAVIAVLFVTALIWLEFRFKPAGDKTVSVLETPTD